MDLPVGTGNVDGIQPVVENVETVEVVTGTERVLSPGGTDTTLKIVAPTQLSVPSSGIIEIDPHSLQCSLVEMASHQLVQHTPTILPSSLTTTMPASVMAMGDHSPLVAGTKRPIMSDTLIGDSFSDLPRKKSRNYLDSHKTIEKKRRDRINTGLGTLKEMVPDCRQYGSKKLDKAEIIEMTIEFIHRLQSQGNGRTGNLDMMVSQREWANDIMTWIFQNKLLYTGPNALEQFCNSLLLHLQSYGNSSGGNVSSPSSNMLLNQVVSTSSSEDDSLLRNQNNNLSFLQQLVSTAGPNTTPSPVKEPPVTSNNSPMQQQQAQLAQIQALLLLQQQQQLINQGQQQDGGTGPQVDSQTQQIHQLQQLHQLQTLLLQHLANETGGGAHQKQSTPTSEPEVGVALSQGGDDTDTSVQTLIVDPGIADTSSITQNSTVDLTLSSTTSETLDPNPIYSTTSLEENLIVTQRNEHGNSQMWSQTGDQQHDSPLLLDTSGVQEHNIHSEVQEEVELAP